ncbi:hypothetical protein D3C85_1804430 [compost metagenome]
MAKLSKLGEPVSPAMNGMSTLFTKAVTTAPKAVPITTATARSTTLPFMMKFLNPVNIGSRLAH